MRGLDATTGRMIENEAYVGQLVGKALTTPVGSRVQRRELGSILVELIDQPFNPVTRQRLVAAAAAAIGSWLPFLQLSRVQIDRNPDTGAVDLLLDIIRPRAGQANASQRLTIPLRPADAASAAI